MVSDMPRTLLFSTGAVFVSVWCIFCRMYRYRFAFIADPDVAILPVIHTWNNIRCASRAENPAADTTVVLSSPRRKCRLALVAFDSPLVRNPILLTQSSTPQSPEDLGNLQICPFGARAHPIILVNYPTQVNAGSGV